MRVPLARVTCFNGMLGCHAGHIYHIVEVGGVLLNLSQHPLDFLRPAQVALQRCVIGRPAWSG